MYLGKFIKKIDKKFYNTHFSGVTFDSSKVKKNFIFFALRGNRFDGNDYIQDAIKRGAKVIISEKKIKSKNKEVIFIKSKNPRKLLADLSYKFIKKNPKKLIAVTGTNGKSSVADFYYQILNLCKKRAASIGTIGIQSKNIRKKTSNTTLNPIELSKIINFLKIKKIDHVILEASSHGLKQNRLDGLNFDIGIFTNLSHDHLDYHKTMKNYFSSKLYLFERLMKKKSNIISDATITQISKIKNIGLKKNSKLNLIFDKKKGIDLISHNFSNEKQILEIMFKNKKYKIELNLIGKIQIKNVLMAILASNKSGIEFNKIIKTINKIKPVEGRLEKIGKVDNNSKVILDYAHTPEALELALKNIKEQFSESRIILVFGCGGNRDQKKRSLMGKIAEKHSDKIYLTDDNPRFESPFKIRKDIKKGFNRIKFEEIPNRKKAIDQAIQNLKSGDILLVAGKGHEKTQDYGNKKSYFSDRETILDSIKIKNKNLSKDFKVNIIKEHSHNKIQKNLSIKNISINSKSIQKNDVFFAIKGKKKDGNKFASEALKKKSCFSNCK